MHEYIKYDTFVMDDENRAKLIVLLKEVFIDAADKHTTAFKKAGVGDTHKRLLGDLKQCLRDAENPRMDVKAIFTKTNETFSALTSHPIWIAHAEKLHRAAEEKAAQLEKADAFMKTFSSYTYLLHTDKLMVLTDEEVKAEVFDEPKPKRLYSLLLPAQAAQEAANVPYWVSHKKTGESLEANICDVWIKDPLRVKLTGITFDPRSTNRIVNKEFNIWQGWRDWGTAVKGDDDVFWNELVLKRICGGNQSYFDFVQKWLAHMIQKPWERPLCALGIKGGQGSGKTSFAKVIGGLMHERHYNDNVTMDHITGQQQGRDLEGVLLAYLDEATWGGDVKLTGFVKKAITGPSDRINEKFLPAYNIPTYKRILFTSNEGYYYHAEADDRRLLPLEIPEPLGKLSHEDSQVLFDVEEYRPHVQAAVLETLKSIDLTGWVPHRELNKLHITTGAEIAERSMDNVERWLKYSIENQAFEYKDRDGDLQILNDKAIGVNELKQSYEAFCSYSSRDRGTQVNLSAHAPASTLRKVFGCEPKNMKMDGKQSRGYAIDWSAMKTNFYQGRNWKPKAEVVVDDADENILRFESPKKAKLHAIAAAMS